MAKLRPFKALRPIRDKAHLVASLPYYAYKKNVLKAMLQVNPYLFLNIINPEFKSKIKTEPNSKERFMQVSEQYQKFVSKRILIKDDQPSIYLYRQTKGDKEFLGVIGGASVEEYNNNKIKKHEATLTSREAMFTNYLDIVGYNAEPVLLSYSGTEDINNLMHLKIEERPEYEFTTTDLNKHELWILNESESAKMVKAFEALDSTYIADGHHRCASSAGLSQLRANREQTHYENEDYFLAFFIDETNIQILEFNRIIKTLNDNSPEEIIRFLKKNFKVEPLKRAKKPSKVHEISMCIDKSWYLLTCKNEIIDSSHSVNCLDTELVTEHVLKPILGIKDLKSDDKIDFISGNHPIREINKRMKKGGFRIGFVFYPVSIGALKRVADNQMIMPPKSTWIEPKMRSGLTIYDINE